MKPRYLGFFVVVLVLIASCTGKAAKDQEADAFKSMEQIYAEEGIPVRIREVQRTAFSTHLKFPARLQAKVESTASAAVTDVVREIHANVGDPVEKDQVVVSFSTTNPAYQQAKLALDNAESNFRRSRELYEQRGISQQAFEAAQNAYEMARTAFQSADDRIHVKAPISGILTRLWVQVSSNVKSGDKLFTVSNLDRMEAIVWVGAPEMEKIRVGQAVRLRWNEQVLAGRVSRRSLVMDAEKKAFQVVAEFANPRRVLTSGLTADVEIETYRNPRAVVVRRTEVLREGPLYYAYVENNGFAARRKLTIRAEEGFDLEVESGLEEGERLIVESLHLLSDGAKIRIVP
ncbi:MAG: efflux RND transporter periplasmic adaptor subunit [Spirochaetales bacterium]